MFQGTRRRRKRFWSSENLLFSICGIHLYTRISTHAATHTAQFYTFGIRSTYFSKHVLAGLVRNRFEDQEVRTDLFNIFVGQSDLVLNIVFGGSVFFAEPAEESGDPLRPLFCISNRFRETVVL